MSVICHDSGFGDRVIVGDEGVEKYKERIRVARKILAEVNQTLQGLRGSTWMLNYHYSTRPMTMKF